MRVRASMEWKRILTWTAVVVYFAVGGYFATIMYALSKWGGNPDWPRIVLVFFAWPLVYLWERLAAAFS